MRAGRDRLLTWMAIVLASGIAIYGLNLIVLGPVLMIGVPDGGSTAINDPSVAGAFPLAGAVLVLLGIRSRRDVLALLGAAAILVFAVLFVFSIGGIVIPFAIALLLVLAVRTLTSAKMVPT